MSAHVSPETGGMTSTTTPTGTPPSTLRTTDGGESIGSTNLRAAMRESIRMDPPVLPLDPTGNVGNRFGDAANDPHACAGTLSPACMSEAEFVVEIERQRSVWNEAIDALLDATAPGWREERARQQAARTDAAAVTA